MTKITSLDGLQNLQGLISLAVYHTRITNLFPISKLETLQALDIEGTLVDTLAPISKLIYLRKLDIARTKITDLSPIKHFRKLEQLRLDSAPISSLEPLANIKSLAIAAKQHRFYYGYGISFGKCPILDRNVAKFSEKKNPESTVAVIAYLREQQGLPPIADEELERAPGSDLPGAGPPPLDNIPSPYAFHLSTEGKIGLVSSSANWPLFPFRTSEHDHSKRLEACKTLADDLISDLNAGKFQARDEYTSSLQRYNSRLPCRPGDGNILLADAEARTLRNLFAAEAEILAVPFASKLKTFLEQHIGLRVFYPEIAKFYRDVQSGRLRIHCRLMP